MKRGLQSIIKNISKRSNLDLLDFDRLFDDDDDKSLDVDDDDDDNDDANDKAFVYNFCGNDYRFFNVTHQSRGVLENAGLMVLNVWNIDWENFILMSYLREKVLKQDLV